jgi:hypothetical protein
MTEQVQYTHDQIIERYLALRNEKKQLEDDVKLKLGDIDRRMGIIENFLLSTLTASGVESMRTKHGTCFKHIKTNVNIADKEVYLSYVKQRDDLTLLTVSANKTRVLEILDETGVLPPGLNMSRTVTINVRKGTSVGN